ncbi:MAG: hypothetical protein AAGF31_00855 [Planctomycetota bacterium]
MPQEIDVDLTGWTEPEATRYALGRPWRRADGRAVATDGRALVVLDDGSAYAEPEGKVPDLTRDGFLDAIDRPPAEMQAMPEVDGPPECADAWWNQHEPCIECRGRGYCLHCQHECEECEGKGDLGTSWHAIKSTVVIDGLKIDRRYAWMASQFPGCRAAAIDFCQAKCLLFRFAGGGGLIMPMKDAGDE